MKLDKLIANLLKTRDALYKGKEYLTILVYFGVLFSLDFSGVMDLYGQNFVRRLINMHRRKDEFAYQKKLKPFCEPVKKMISQEDVKKLQSIKVPDKRDISVFTRQNTTTHQCCKDFSETERQIIEEIKEKVRRKYETEIGKKLYNYASNVETIYVYHGKNAQHLWHVDPNNLSEIYNVIICFKKIGGISPLQCKNIDGEIKSVHFEEGDAAIFNGGTTVHQVPPNDDDDSERTVLSIAYVSDNKFNESGSNMCTYLEGGNQYYNVVKLILTVFFINLIISVISGIHLLSYKSLVLFVVLVLVVVKYIPLYFDLGWLGSGRASSILGNLIVLFLIMINTISIKGAILFFSYFALSDVFFARSWVEYD